MRLHNIAAILMSLMAVPASADDSKVQFASQNDKISYALGMDIFSNIKQLPKDLGLNQDMILRGVQDSFANKSALTEEEATKLKAEFEKQIKENLIKMQEQKMAENIKAGEEFLANNKKRAEVKVTNSGLQYEVLQEGTGAQPKDTDNVTVHYKGTLLTGEVFDSSYARNEPATFPLNAVIKGWGEGVQLMKVGSKYKFFIKPELAYGKYGAPPKIGPNETLIFEVELLGINEKK